MDDLTKTIDVDDIDEDVQDTESEEDSTTIVEGYTGERITSVLKAIKKKCLNCCAYQRDEVKYCSATSCELWPFRLGRNPYRKKRNLTEEQKQKIKERMLQNRNKN